MKNKGFLYTARRIKNSDPAARSLLEVLLLYPGLHAIGFYRISHLFYKIHFYFIARLISQLGRFFTQIEIHPGAKIGKGVFIDHGSGIVIGETAIVEDDCTIFHGVTLGGTAAEGCRHPHLGKNVLVGAHAQIIGPVYIGDNCKIGANAIIMEDIAANTTAVGVRKGGPQTACLYRF